MKRVVALFMGLGCPIIYSSESLASTEKFIGRKLETGTRTIAMTTTKGTVRPVRPGEPFLTGKLYTQSQLDFVANNTLNDLERDMQDAHMGIESDLNNRLAMIADLQKSTLEQYAALANAESKVAKIQAHMLDLQRAQQYIDAFKMGRTDLSRDVVIALEQENDVASLPRVTEEYQKAYADLQEMRKNLKQPSEQFRTVYEQQISLEN